MASTVLPNGIIIPEKYSRDWYADLYHNWQELDNLLGGGTPKDGTLTIQKNGSTVGTFSANQATNETIDITVPTKTSDLTNDSGFITEDNTKIPLAGSNQISGDLIPSTDGTVNLGGVSYQWNNAYIKSLTINGVVCGDILTHNASEFVNVSSNQTIGGVKTFSKISLKSSRIERGSLPSSNITEDTEIEIVDKNSRRILGVYNYYYTDGSGRTSFYVYNPNTTDYDNIAISFNFGRDNQKSLWPGADNTIDLGISTRRWKSFNGVNPGALSLPGTFVNVDTTNWVLDGSDANIFTPASDGWLGIQATDTVYDQMHYVFVGRTGGGSTYYQQNLMSPISALWDSEYHGCVFIPVVKNINYDIRCICSSITATFYPCQGNV